MPPKCYICNYYDPKKVSLFRIPDRNDEYSERGGLWLKLLEERAENMHRIRICSEHFLKKKPAKSSDYLDLDWVPNKNLGRFAKNWKMIDYHFRTKKKISPLQNLNNYRNQSITTNSANSDIAKNTDDLEYNEFVASANSNNLENNDFVASVNSNNLENDDFNVAANSSEFPKSILNYPDKTVSQSTIEPANSNNLESNDLNVVNVCATVNSSDFTKSILYYPAESQQSRTNNPVSNGATEKASTTLLIPVKRRKVNIIQQKIFFPKDIQTDLTASDIDMLFKYYQNVVEERNALLLKISTLVIDIDFFKGNDKKTRFFTGLPTWSLLNNFFEMIKEFLPTHPNCKLSRFQMVALTLMKLRLNLKFTDIAYRFQVSISTASRYFHRCIYILFKLFYNSQLIHWPERKNLLMNTPSYFRSTFKELITIIIDCFELFIETSSVLMAAAQAYSKYKHNETLKYLLGISTTGAILFVSKGFGGRASDKKVVNESKFLDNLEEGDLVLADKGFLIENEVEAKKASLRIPSFVRNGNQLHPTEVEQSRNYSRIRIHVERLICVLREKFNICSDKAEMSAVAKQNDLFDRDLYDKIIFICCCLVNICPPVINNDFEI